MRIRVLELLPPGSRIASGERLGTVLQKITPTVLVLDMSTLRPSSMQIDIEQHGIRLDGTAAGSTRPVLR
jgi:hypothetical protein